MDRCNGCFGCIEPCDGGEPESKARAFLIASREKIDRYIKDIESRSKPHTLDLFLEEVDKSCDSYTIPLADMLSTL
jgi:hypothetical protein